MPLLTPLYHCDRYFRERRQLLPLITEHDQASSPLRTAHLSPDDRDYWVEREKRAWNNICSFLGENEVESCFELVQREQDYERTIERFERDGAGIFQFQPSLVEMLHATEVGSVEIGSIRFPYPTLYIDLGEFDFLPEISKTHRIEGMYLTDDSLEDMLRRSVEWPDHSFLNEAKPDLYTEDEWKDMRADLLNEKYVNESRLTQLKRDPDSFNYDDDEYSMLLAHFVFRRRDNHGIELSGPEIVEEPSFRISLNVPRHTTTVDEAIEHTIENGLPSDTYDDTVEYGKSVRNVTNYPEHLREALRLIFNLLCYLNVKDNDVERRLSSERFEKKLSRASTKKARDRVLSKARTQGVRHVQFCGHRTFSHESMKGAQAKATHWRRGHWRNQAFGKELSGRRLVWIRPVVVKGKTDQPYDRRVYDVERPVNK